MDKGPNCTIEKYPARKNNDFMIKVLRTISVPQHGSQKTVPQGHGARSRYANRADVSVSVAIPPERRDWNFQTVARAAGGVPRDPLTITLTLVEGNGGVCLPAC